MTADNRNPSHPAFWQQAARDHQMHASIAHNDRDRQHHMREADLCEARAAAIAAIDSRYSR